MRRRGITLLEMMVAMAVTAILWIAVMRAYVDGSNYERRLRAGNDAEHVRQAFEAKLTDLFKHAYVSPDTADTTTYFTTTPSSTTATLTNQTQSGNADTVIFTTTGVRIPGSVMETDDDFETANSTFGPQGGTSEIALSMTPVGQPTSNQTGLFIRNQTPSDGDNSQGGQESVLDPNVTSIQFEFWDGSLWQQSWDTASTDQRRLPAAVRVTYRINGETNDRVAVIRIPLSDVTAANPITQGGA